MNEKLYNLSPEKADVKWICSLWSSEGDNWALSFYNFLFSSAQFYQTNLGSDIK